MYVYVQILCHTKIVSILEKYSLFALLTTRIWVCYKPSYL